MADIDKYMKMAKKVVIKPEDNSIEDKIIERISSVKESDKSLLDGNFMDYLKKSNSRLYLFSEGIKNNPGRFILVLMSIFAVLALIVFIFRKNAQLCRKPENGRKNPEAD